MHCPAGQPVSSACPSTMGGVLDLAFLILGGWLVLNGFHDVRIQGFPVEYHFNVMADWYALLFVPLVVGLLCFHTPYQHLLEQWFSNCHYKR